jgi:hypothetical protein
MLGDAGGVAGGPVVVVRGAEDGAMDEWPDLPYPAWRATRETLHRCAQVIGKLRLALAPFEPQWANVPLYVTARGLTTSPVPCGLRTFDAELDLLDHVVVLRTSDGGLERVPLGPRAVADFHAEVMAALDRLGLAVTISETPSEVPDPIPFPEDRVHHEYEPEPVTRFFRTLSRVDVVMKRHRARFLGRTTPVHFFWGSFDLANTRFSGRPAEPPPGADVIMRRSEDAEQVTAGFWPGDGRTPYPAFFTYGYPRPDGVELARPRPEGAAWVEEAGLFVLPYDTARAAPDPARAILDFLESTYEACAVRMGWSDDLVAPATGGRGN